MTTCHSETANPQLFFNETEHRYFAGGIELPSVTRVLSSAGLFDYNFLSAEHREQCLERGRRVHRATEQDDQAGLDEESLDAEILPYIEAWRKFKRDFQFTPEWIERRVFHPLFRYGGTIDRVGRIRNGDQWLVDLKTGQAPNATRYQTAAYSACLKHPRTYARRAVELRSDASYHVIAYDAGDYWSDFTVFAAALRAFQKKEDL